jgi:Tir chaperone protein (CesT) family
MTLLEEVIADYCRRQGVTVPVPEGDGVYTLCFDDKYNVELQASGRDQILLRANLGALKDDAGRKDALRRLLHINLALSERKRSTLSLDSARNMPFLYDLLAVSLSDLPSSERAITGFVNEVAAFHTALERSRHV